MRRSPAWSIKVTDTDLRTVDRARLGRRLTQAIEAEDAAALALAYEALRKQGLANVRMHAGVANAAARFDAPDLAEEAFEAALALRPGDPALTHQRGMARLRAGRWREGWRDFESRLDAYRLLPFPVDGAVGPVPRWRLGEPVPRRLLVFTEQGAGDTVQFARFALRLAEQGVAIRVVASPRLAALVRALGLEVVEPARGDRLPVDADRWCAMMSLPGLMDCHHEDDLRAAPYLRIDETRTGRPSGRLAIGLAWRGNPRHPNNAARSAPLSAFAPLLRLEGVECFNLQVEDGAGEPEEALLSPRPRHDDRPFLSAIRSIAHMDLVISVDSAVAHLAGAQGTPCLLLLPAHPHDWRWRGGRDETLWYPHMTKLQRGPRETWTARIARLAAQIASQPQTVAASVSSPERWKSHAP